MGSAKAWAHAGLGLVNAIGTGGYGAAVALDLWLWIEAWPCNGSRGYTVTRGRRVEIDPVILDSVSEVVEGFTGRGLGGLCARGWSEIPLEAGLKGSSALINALIGAALSLLGAGSPGLLGLARLGVKAARLAGLTVTGALDDHLAVSGCGTYATDNREQRLLRSWSGPSWVVAVAVPGRRSIKRIDVAGFERYRALYEAAWRLLERGEHGYAALVNGVATMLATGGDPGVLAELVSNGALAAGVSGKGPAVYAATGSEEEAQRLKTVLEKRIGGEVLVAKTITCAERSEETRNVGARKRSP